MIAQTPEDPFHIGIMYGYLKACPDTNPESTARTPSTSASMAS